MHLWPDESAPVATPAAIRTNAPPPWRWEQFVEDGRDGSITYRLITKGKTVAYVDSIQASGHEKPRYWVVGGVTFEHLSTAQCFARRRHEQEESHREQIRAALLCGATVGALIGGLVVTCVFYLPILMRATQ